jgi:hypothetical protein
LALLLFAALLPALLLLLPVVKGAAEAAAASLFGSRTSEDMVVEGRGHALLSPLAKLLLLSLGDWTLRGTRRDGGFVLEGAFTPSVLRRYSWGQARLMY